MTIAGGGTLGLSQSGASSTSLSHTTVTNTLATDNEALLVVVSDNIATVDGASNTHTSVTGGTGTWTKISEQTNSPGGVAADGVTISLWKFRASASNAVGTVFTITFSAAVVDKAGSMWRFTVAAGQTLTLTTGTTNPIANETTGAANFGSATSADSPASIGSTSGHWRRKPIARSR